MLFALLRGALAGAWPVAPGYGQFIAGVGFSEGDRTFSTGGRPQPTPAYRQIAASGFLEYGLTPALTVVAAPTLARQSGDAANTVTGSDSSAFGARLRLAEAQGRVAAVQVLVQPPIGHPSFASELVTGGAQSFATDIRLMFGQSFLLFGRPAFVEAAPGARVRLDPFPSEARLDLTFGVRPLPRWLVLAQAFLIAAPPAGPLVPRSASDKVQASVVYDVTPRWSVQVGAFHTVAGNNVVRETGPFGALWYRF
jgi:protein XagA